MDKKFKIECQNENTLSEKTIIYIHGYNEKLDEYLIIKSYIINLNECKTKNIYKSKISDIILENV